ncbi:MAG: hypothetical protein K9L85_00720 [Candidatus Peribacteraceae bacterium]|nr:hypothetical protein [Candidatus Peribacteraceae bacterium]
MNKKFLKILKWSTRILALAAIIFGLPFYFGYGNPLPFINPDYSVWDNVWLSTFPLMFIGLGVGWKYPKVGGYLIVLPIVIASILGLITDGEAAGPMLIPLAIGVLYLVVGYKS